MEQKVIEKRLVRVNEAGQEIYVFKIPNSTNDCLEVSNEGCQIQSILIHDKKRKMYELICGQEKKSIFSSLGKLESNLSKKVWDIAEEGDNYVFFSCECDAEETGCDCRLKIGVRIMWVNLNRLVLDIYLTPEKDIRYVWGSTLLLNPDGEGKEWKVRSFLPLVDEEMVEKTVFSKQKFGELPENRETVFSSNSVQEIRPVLEIDEYKSELMVSVYSTFSECRVTKENGEVSLNHTEKIHLKAGESLAERVIYGFDFPNLDIDGDPKVNPFMMFGLGV